MDARVDVLNVLNNYLRYDMSPRFHNSNKSQQEKLIATRFYLNNYCVRAFVRSLNILKYFILPNST